jgi:hypothetical protein
MRPIIISNASARPQPTGAETSITYAETTTEENKLTV